MGSIVFGALSPSWAADSVMRITYSQVWVWDLYVSHGAWFVRCVYGSFFLLVGGWLCQWVFVLQDDLAHRKLLVRRPNARRMRAGYTQSPSPPHPEYQVPRGAGVLLWFKHLFTVALMNPRWSFCNLTGRWGCKEHLVRAFPPRRIPIFPLEDLD